ncbi:MAG: ROK family protein [Candidatus Saccharibacteria bacterium]|nr:ROK family protein [Candidatus Saccharibacteria bacterium]
MVNGTPLPAGIAIGLIDVIATLTPEVIIFGGGVGAHFDKYQDRLMEELKIYENPLLTLPKIIQATRPEEAVVYGCYELAKDQDSPEKHFKTRLK